MATFVDLMLTNDAIEYIGTLYRISTVFPNSGMCNQHQQYSYHVSLKQRLPVVFPAFLLTFVFYGEIAGSCTFGAIQTCWYVSYEKTIAGDFEYTYTIDSNDATRAQTPATIIAALLNFSPVPPERPPPTMVGMGD
jgi:hypothetical protein